MESPSEEEAAKWPVEGRDEVRLAESGIQFFGIRYGLVLGDLEPVTMYTGDLGGVAEGEGLNGKAFSRAGVVGLLRGRGMCGLAAGLPPGTELHCGGMFTLMESDWAAECSGDAESDSSDFSRSRGCGMSSSSS